MEETTCNHPECLEHYRKERKKDFCFGLSKLLISGLFLVIFVLFFSSLPFGWMMLVGYLGFVPTVIATLFFVAGWQDMVAKTTFRCSDFAVLIRA